METQMAPRAALVHSTSLRTRSRTQTCSAMPSSSAAPSSASTQPMEELGRGQAVQHRARVLTAQQVGRAALSRMTAREREGADPAGMVLVGTGMEMVAGTTSNAGGAADDAEATDSSRVPHSAALDGARNGTLPANISGDLRKSLLKSEQAKSTRGQTHPLPSPSPMSSRKPSPIPMALDGEAAVAPSRSRSPALAPALVPVSITTAVTDLNLAGAEKRRFKWRSFFTNTWFYALLRMVEVRGFHLLLHKPWN